MADLSVNFVGIKAPNPFWLASAPPTDKAYNIERAFRAGWGGVVWKTLGEDGPPVVNVSGPRYGAVHGPDRRVAAFNNIELITDRPLEINLQEIAEMKRRWPDRAVVVSLMVPCEEDAWKRILPRVEATGADGVELNFGCPHGMSERGRADAVSLINTINSIMGVDLDRMVPSPHTDGKATHGGMCGPAVKPIALNMVAEIARSPATRGLPISGIGGIETWRDAAEFIALGSGTVQVCTAAMVYGFKIVQEMVTGLEAFMDEQGYAKVSDFVGAAVPNVTDWQYLNLNYAVKARIDQDLCIKCGRCHVACEDTSHQAITHLVNGVRHFEVIDEECVGCNLCASICPIENCITMEPLVNEVDRRTGRLVDGSYLNWTQHPNNPQSAAARKPLEPLEPAE